MESGKDSGLCRIRHKGTRQPFREGVDDFLTFSKDHAVRVGTKPGTMVFVNKRYIGPAVRPAGGKRWSDEHNDPKNWVEEEFEVEPDPSMQEIVEQTRQVFGVDISTVCRGPLVDSLLHITQHYKGQTIRERPSI